MNCWGSDRNDIIKELNDNKEVLAGDKELVRQIYKLKEECQFKKEMPIGSKNTAGYVKTIDSNLHGRATNGGYSRSPNGYPYCY